ncbi:hypothetical protein ACFO26_01605 [Lactococcus nasutitermitis]|uniref:DUF4044 domain-containing protein n=1 Tax=Lactococcus nasutitermitis TaxID=1652957 RepID=A0ABV9JDP4_9LACT|nr:hypothetical protein [Lactococcus nasutitermitis]
MNPIKKLFNFYVRLYVSEDVENGKPRIGIKRLLFLGINLFFLGMMGLIIIYVVIKIMGTLLGGL